LIGIITNKEIKASKVNTAMGIGGFNSAMNGAEAAKSRPNILQNPNAVEAILIGKRIGVEMKQAQYAMLHPYLANSTKTAISAALSNAF